MRARCAGKPFHEGRADFALAGIFACTRMRCEWLLPMLEKGGPSVCQEASTPRKKKEKKEKEEERHSRTAARPSSTQA